MDNSDFSIGFTVGCLISVIIGLILAIIVGSLVDKTWRNDAIEQKHGEMVIIDPLRGITEFQWIPMEQQPENEGCE